MLKKLRNLWDWIWDVDEVRTTIKLRTSVSGLPLVTFRSSLSGWSMGHTEEGLRGAAVAMSITQCGNNIESIKSLLKREYDDYLSEEDYKNLVASVQTRLEQGGYYLDTRRNRAGHLDFVRVAWSEEDKEIITKLLASYLGG